MLRKLRRLTDLSLTEHILFIQFIALSYGLRIALSSLSLPRFMSLLSSMRGHFLLDWIPVFHLRCETHRLLHLIDLATTVSHGSGRCLPRSLLTVWLLSRHHSSITLCLGISKSRGSLQGHAWVEQDGVVVGDTRSFTDHYTLVHRLPA